MRPELAAQLERLQQILRKHNRPLTLRPGASDQVIGAFENRTNIRFDEDLRALYQFSNGGEYNDTWFAAETDELIHFRFCDLKEVQEIISWGPSSFDAEWNNGGEPWDSRVKKYDHHSLWLPFADFGNSVAYVMFDADPAPSGRYGQIITYQHDPDAIRYCADGLVGFLKMSNDLLETRSKKFHLG